MSDSSLSSSSSTTSTTSVSSWEEERGVLPVSGDAVIVVDGNSSVLVDNPPPTVAKSFSPCPTEPLIEIKFEKAAHYGPTFVAFMGMVLFNGWGYMVYGYRRRAFAMFVWNVIVALLCHTINLFTPLLPIGFVLYIGFCLQNFFDVRHIGKQLRKGETPNEWFTLNPAWRRLMNSKVGILLHEPWPNVPPFLDSKEGRVRRKATNDSMQGSLGDPEGGAQEEYDFWMTRLIKGDRNVALAWLCASLFAVFDCMLLYEILSNVGFWFLSVFVVAFSEASLAGLYIISSSFALMGCAYRKSEDARARLYGKLCVVATCVILLLGQNYFWMLQWSWLGSAISSSVYIPLIVAGVLAESSTAE